MAGELPVCTRCCFCLPLRYGLLAWGYIKLIASFILILSMSITLFYTIAMARFYRNQQNGSRFNIDIILMTLLLTLLVTDFVLNIVFITGGHRKNVKLLRVYYFYSIVLWVLMIILSVFFITLTIRGWFMYFRSISSWIIRSMDFAGYFVNIVMQAYFVLLLRSEILKLKNNCEFRFVNNAAEAECTIIDEEEVTIDKEQTGDVSEKFEDNCQPKDTGDNTYMTVAC